MVRSSARDEPLLSRQSIFEQRPTFDERSYVFRMNAPIESTTASPSFLQFPLHESIHRAIQDAGYQVPTPIQLQTIPGLLNGSDVLGTAQTGSGKTAAFAIPMLNKIDLQKAVPQILVLTPTRELAMQVAESFEKYGQYLKGLRVAAIYGGQDYQVQFRKLDRGAHVIVGTPGRMLDHLRRGSLQLNDLSGLVLDEADEMLRMGFTEDVNAILEQTPESKQIALFSATMPPTIREIASNHLKSPIKIDIHRETKTADSIRQRYLVVLPSQKEEALRRIIEVEASEAVLVFVRTRSTCEPIADYLAQSGLRTAALHGEVPQKQREKIVEQLRQGTIDIIVATDVAARGLDVSRISHVINYDLPMDSEVYTHRIGRTGRAGRSGEAILLLTPRDRSRLRRLEQETRQPLEQMAMPTNREINKLRVAKFHSKIDELMEHPEMESYLSILQQYQRNHEEIPPEKIAAALAILANNHHSLLERGEFRAVTFEERGSGKRMRDRDGRAPHPRDRHPSDRQDRGQSFDRGDRQESRHGRSLRQRDEPMETFRVEVGRRDGVSPGHLVGAIANEIGIEGDYIGRIRIQDDHSFVDLPEGLPDDLFAILRRVFVMGKPMKISRARGGFNDRNDRPRFRDQEDRPRARRDRQPAQEGAPTRKKRKRPAALPS